MAWDAPARAIAQLFESFGVLVIAVDVLEQADEFGEGGFVDSAAELLDAVAGAFAKLLESPAGFSDADDRNVQIAALDHGLQRREDLFVG